MMKIFVQPSMNHDLTQSLADKWQLSLREIMSWLRFAEIIDGQRAHDVIRLSCASA